MINSKKLKDRAKSMGIKQADMAAALGLRQSSVNQKINNTRPMLLDEAEKLADLLQITDDDFRAYFFA